MEMEDEKNVETDSADGDDLTAEENFGEDQYEITVGDIDSGELEFDVVDDEDEDRDNAIEEELEKENEEEEEVELAVSDSGDLDFDVVDDEDVEAKKVDEEVDVNEALDFENDDAELDNLPPLEESDLEDLDFDVATDEANDEEVENLDAELDDLPPLEESELEDIDLVEPLDYTADFAETASQDELFDKFDEDDLSPFSFAGKQLVIFDTAKEQAELLKKYLSERTGMEVECVGKKENLWRFLKIDPLDLIIMETGTEGNSDAMELMQQTKDQFPEVHFICLSGPVSLERRLQFLNAGALDYLTRPLHLSTIAQSILVQFSRTDIYDIEEDFTDLVADAHDIPEEEPIIDTTETKTREKTGSSAKRSDVDLNLADEIDLIDEDF
jgi:DNA-binding response OmpR family regulator